MFLYEAFKPQIRAAFLSGKFNGFMFLTENIKWKFLSLSVSSGY
jgi:hypothetical protein